LPIIASVGLSSSNISVFGGIAGGGNSWVSLILPSTWELSIKGVQVIFLNRCSYSAKACICHNMWDECANKNYSSCCVKY
jgi:hypothetical protein